MNREDEAECKMVVFNFATALNEWENHRYIFGRIQAGKHVSPSRAELVAGLTEEVLTQRHVEMFDRYIYPRDRKYGANPGVPKMFGREGRFRDVSIETITQVVQRDRRTIEVTTDWGYLLPGGRTMFILKKRSNRWLIDSLKTENHDGSWTNAHI